MKTIIISVALLAAIIVSAEEQYTSRYDNVNVQDILKNKRLLKAYTNCLLEKGPCSPDGKELKSVLPEALKTDCRRCNDKHKAGTKTIISHLIDNEPKIWDQLENKYDPQGTYQKKYKARATHEGITL